MLNLYAACNPEIDEFDIALLKKKINELDNDEAMKILDEEGEAIFFIPVNGEYKNLNQYVVCINHYNDGSGLLAETYDGPQDYIMNLGPIVDLPYNCEKRFIIACFNSFEEF